MRLSVMRFPSRLAAEEDACGICAARDAALLAQEVTAEPEGDSSAGVPEELVNFAIMLADAASEVIRPYFRQSTLEVIDKAASTPGVAGSDVDKEDPVTIADREAEDAMRKLIEGKYPGHGIMGEERGPARIASDYIWVLDPIDGTKSFITGTYGWGILISLVRRGVPVIGIIDQPVLHERWLGVEGRVTTLNGAPVSTRSCATLSAATLLTHDPLAATLTEDDGMQAAYRRLSSACKLRRYSQDCYAYALLATGCSDVVVEAKQAAWDYMAVIPVVRGAGGIVCSWDACADDPASQELRLDTGPSGAAAVSVLALGDKRLLSQALELLKR